MQLLDSTGFGLRSARIEMRSPHSDVAVTLFPMIHVGEAAFYKTVYDDACDHDAVLVEGVKSQVTVRVTRAYRWINPSTQIGLVTQPSIPPESRARTTVIHADLSTDEFEVHWRKVPLYQRLLLYVAAPVYGIYYRWFGSRAQLAKGHALDDLPSRDELINWAPEYAALGDAILSARDERLISVMNEYIDAGAKGPRRLAIVYGAQHMRAVLKALTQKGFHAVKTEWRSVFGLEREELAREA